MITDKRINVIVAIVMALAVAVTCIIMAFPKSSESGNTSYEYPEKLFSKDKISIDIQVDKDKWQNMLDNATKEEYIMGDLVVEGKKFSSVGIRPKGNSSLTTVASSDSDRFSFKFQFDKYVEGQTCYGLDKFVVNNIQSDSSYMKEYLSYDMMKFMGVDCPLYTYANITVNGEDWGLYLAIESYEDSFVQRNYGTSDGNLYSVKMVSGGGNMGGNQDDTADAGQGNFQRPNQQNSDTNTTDDSQSDSTDKQTGQGNVQPPSGDMKPPNETTTSGSGSSDTTDKSSTTDTTGNTSDTIGNRPQMGAGMQMPNGNKGGFGGGQMGGGMGGNNGGSLEYTDDNSDSYSSIFKNAVFSTSDEDDFQRVITALKNLSTGTDLEKYFNVDQILRYFAVHTTVVNLDSYVSNMQQNYCLYENDGKVTILPWDYNLAFGGFQSGTASSAVNFPIDTPVSGIELSERPLLAKLLEVDEYKEKYHQYLQEIVDGYFNSGLYEKTIDKVDSIISDSVKNDATAFYTYDEYVKGVDTLTQFGLLRAKSIQGQLDGTIPSTTDGQTDSDALIDASSINLSDMGTQGGGKDGGQMGGGMGGNMQGGFRRTDSNSTGTSDTQKNSSVDTKTSATVDANKGNHQTMPNGDNSNTSQTSTAKTGNQQITMLSKENIIIAGGTLVILAAGILFVKKYKKK